MLNIPIDFSTDNRRDLNKESITIILDKCLKDDLEKINSGLDIQSFMLASYFVLMARLSNEKDILVGVSIKNSIRPIRISMEDIKTFEELFVLVKEKLKNARKYNFVFEQIITDGSYETLFQTTFSMNSNKKLANKSMLNWQLKEQDTNIMLNVEYDDNLFKSKTIKRFTEYYINILKAVLKDQKS